MKRFECVPNFSEGRDRSVLDALAEAARSVPGVALLDLESNADHNRCVLSLVGEGEALSEAVFRTAQVAVGRIDLRRHKGEHPRMGAVDVIPFVPLGSATNDEAIALAVRLGERLWRELRLPVYLYGAAARLPERADLAYLRRGQFEGIREAIVSDPARRPDFGDAAVHESAGIVAIGARPVLIAFNAYLTTPDVEVAKRVARATRARDGGLAEVKALGFEIRERNRAQVSMNLTDFRRTPIHRALESVRREAARYGVGIEESEIVGLVPEDALLDAAEFYLQLNKFDRGTILERKVREAESTVVAGGDGPTPFASGTLAEFVDRLAARTPTPGGGSAAAVAGALGAALGAMVLAYSQEAGRPSAELAPLADRLGAGRHRFLALADEDARSYEGVRTARRERRSAPLSDRGALERVLAATRKATEVPRETATLAAELAAALETARPKVRATVESDRVSAVALLRAAEAAALANVETNLSDLRRLEADASPTGPP